MRVYLSARYARLDELKAFREDLRKVGIFCTSRWLDGGTFENNAENAQIDVVDVLDSDVLVNFTDEPVEHSPHSFAARGGRHVEYGLAIGAGVLRIVVGPRENVFHYLSDTIVVGTWEEALAELVDMAPDYEHGPCDCGAGH